MQLIVLSILAIANLGTWKYAYSYKSGIVAYTPGLAKFPVQSAYIPGYVRYIDDNGVQRLIGYTYTKPFYQVRQPISYVKSAFVASTPILKTIGSIAVPNQQNKASDLVAARETHFLTWAQQQYQALKKEIDVLRNAGKQPSANMIEKLLPLEKIATTSNFASIREHPDVKLIREEHLRLWNEAATKTLHADVESIRSVNTQSPIYIKSFEETFEQNLPYGSHLLVQSPQIADLKQLEANRLQERNQAPVSKLLYYGEGQNIYQQQDVAGVQEQLRLWNAKSETAVQSNRKQSEIHSPDSHHKVYFNKNAYTPNIRGGEAVKHPQEVQAEAEYLQPTVSENQHGVKTHFNGAQSIGQQMLYGAPLHTNYYINSASEVPNDGKSAITNTQLFGKKMIQGVLSNTQYHPSGVIDNYNDMKSTLIGGQLTGQQVVQGLQTSTPYHLNAASKVLHNAESALTGSHSIAQQPVHDLKSSTHAGDVLHNYHDVKSDFTHVQPLGEQGVGQPANNYGTKLVHLEIPSTYQELLKQHTFVSHPESLVESVYAGEDVLKQQVGEQNIVAHAYDTQIMHGGIHELHGMKSMQPHMLGQKDFVANSGVSDDHYGVKSFVNPEQIVHHSSARHPINALPSITYNSDGVIENNYNRKALDTLDTFNGQHVTSHQIYNVNSNLHPKNNLKNLHENQEDPQIYMSKSVNLQGQFVNEHNVGQQIQKSYSNITPGNYYETSVQRVHEHGVQNGIKHDRPLVKGQQTSGYQNTAEQTAEHSVQDTHADLRTVHNIAVEVQNGLKSHLSDGQSTIQQGVISQVHSLPALGSYEQHNINSLFIKEQGQEMGKENVYDVHSKNFPELSNVPESQYDAKPIEEIQDVTQHTTTSLGRPNIADESSIRQEVVGLQNSDDRLGENPTVKSRIHEGFSDHKVYFQHPSTALKKHFQHHHIGRHVPNIHSNSYINTATQDHYSVISPFNEGQSTKQHAIDPQRPSVVFESSTPFDLSNQQIRKYQEQSPLPGQQHPNPAEFQTGVSYDHDVLFDNPNGVKSLHDSDEFSVQTYNTQQIDGNPIGKQDHHFLPKKPSVHIEDTPEVKRAREEHFRIFNQIKANTAHQAQSKAFVLTPTDDVAQVVARKQFENVHETREQLQEKLDLQRQRIREAERLQKEQEQLQFEQEREAERLAEEKRQMEAELIHLKGEEKKRAAMDKLLEATQLQKQFSHSNDYKQNSAETISQGSVIASNSEHYNSDKSNVKSNNEMLEQPVVQFLSESQFKHSSNTDAARSEQNQQYLNTPNVGATEMVQNFQTQHSTNKSKPTSEYQSVIQSQIDNEHVHNGSASNTFQELQMATDELLPSNEGAIEQLRFIVDKNSTITSKDC